MQMQQLSMLSRWPIEYALLQLPMPSHSAAGPVHMHYSCRLIQVGPLHRELLLLPMPLCWPILYAITAAADGFALAHYICSFYYCRCLRVGQLHMQLQQMPMPSRWPIAYTLQQPPMDSSWPVA